MQEVRGICNRHKKITVTTQTKMDHLHQIPWLLGAVERSIFLIGFFARDEGRKCRPSHQTSWAVGVTGNTRSSTVRSVYIQLMYLLGYYSIFYLSTCSTPHLVHFTAFMSCHDKRFWRLPQHGPGGGLDEDPSTEE